jgi:alpha-glucosidase
MEIGGNWWKKANLLIAALLMVITVSAGQKHEISSPDGHLKCILLNEDNQLSVSISLDGTPVLEKSALYMSLNGIGITGTVKEGTVNNFTVDETFPWNGLHSVAVNKCNGMTIGLKSSKPKVEYTIEIKVFNDAVAYRTIIPGKSGRINYPDESTVFRIPEKSIVWYHDLYMHYEGVHAKKLSDTIPAGEWAAPPLTYRLPGNAGYASLTEANLTDYAGMALLTTGQNGFAIRLGHSQPASYPYKLRYSKEDVERLSKIAGIDGTITTPWRVILAGKDLNSLVNSDAIASLCPPPDKKLFPEGINTSWAKPGRAVWKYLDGGGDGTLEVTRQFSKLAGELGFEYNILENYWTKWPDDSLKALVDYSGKLGVGIIVWKHSKELRDMQTRLEFFNHLHKLGVAGVKIDFFDHEAKEVTGLYVAMAREAAEQHLVLIFHGANKPTGLSRTYPNIMIYEGVKGMEASKLTDRATHETTIPFTRMLAGPADYSVCHFGTRKQNTTWVHQAATAAIFCAPVITYASTPAHILENPCAGMIKSIPSVWDETKVLAPSEPGELAAFAQRKGSTWFLSVINGLKPKRLEIPLDFLCDGTYKSDILQDIQDNPDAAAVITGRATKNQRLILDLVPGGGYMARYSIQ